MISYTPVFASTSHDQLLLFERIERIELEFGQQRV